MSVQEGLATGPYVIAAPCPGCGQVELVAAELAAVLKVIEGDESSVSVRCKSRAVAHRCDQLRIELAEQPQAALTVDPQTGEVL